jgi:hypothetical protein
MRGKLVIQEQKDYQAWLERQTSQGFARLAPSPVE